LIAWLPSLVSLVLTIVFVLTADTGPRAKGAVVAVFLAALLLQYRGPGLAVPVVGLVLQVVLAVSLLLWLRVSS
jgi:hypothetical protein